MRNTSETPQSVETMLRATFEVPRTLADEFRDLAKRRERTFSAELRKLMADELERERAGDLDAAA